MPIDKPPINKTAEQLEREKYDLRLKSERARLLEEEQNQDYIAPSKIMDEGLFAKHDFKVGDIISQYLIGKYEKFLTAEEIELGSDFDHNCIQIGINEKGEGLYVDVPRRHPRNFENHSCNPNAGLRIIDQPDGTKNSLLVATNPIKKDEEITLDYSTLMFENWDFDDCNCGSPNCRGKITEFQRLPKDLQEKYLKIGIIPKFAVELLEK